jgi:hypothetical protein
MEAIKIAQGNDATAQGVRHVVLGGKAGNHH